MVCLCGYRYQSLTLIPLLYIPTQTNHSHHLPLSTGYLWVYSVVGLRLYFGIQYSMVSGENGLFVWVYSVVGLRLDFGIQYSMVSGENGLFVWVYSVCHCLVSNLRNVASFSGLYILYCPFGFL
jgi:hypothetical protein